MHLGKALATNPDLLRPTRIVIGVGMITMLLIALAGPVRAQRDYTSCGHFESQAAAQEYFDTREISDPSIFDPDGDGLACEDEFRNEGAPAVFDPVSCGHFESQAAAQEYFDTYDLESPGVMDPDEDGIACEFAFGGDVTEPAYVSSQVTTLPSTGTGSGTSEEGGFSPLVAVIVMLILWASALTRHRSGR